MDPSGGQLSAPAAAPAARPVDTPPGGLKVGGGADLRRAANTQWIAANPAAAAAWDVWVTRHPDAARAFAATLSPAKSPTARGGVVDTPPRAPAGASALAPPPPHGPLFTRVGVWNLLAATTYSRLPKCLAPKVDSLARIAQEQAWSACALQECPSGIHAGAIASLAAGQRFFSCWAWAGIDVGLTGGAPGHDAVERAVFGWDTTIFDVVGEGAVLFPDSPAVAGGSTAGGSAVSSASVTTAAGPPYKRRPALLLLRHRAAPGRHVALVSVHSRAWNNADRCTKSRSEARRLGADVAPWVERLAAEMGVAREALATLICGDFNLSERDGGPDQRTAPGDAWEPLRAARFTPALSGVVTNVHEFNSGAEPAREFDNAWLHCGGPWLSPTPEGVAVDVVAHLRDELAAAHAALAGLPHAAELQDAVKAEMKRIAYFEFSDHRPLTVTLWGAQPSAAAARPAGPILSQASECGEAVAASPARAGK